MNKFFLMFVLFFSMSLAHAIERVKLRDGRTAILHEDGTWKYESESRKITGTAENTRSADSSEKLELGKTGFSLYFDPAVWIKTKTEGQRVNFRHKDGDAYAATIPERVEIPIENLKKIAVDNARAVAPDATITSEEWKIVNGAKVLNLQISGTMSGISFVYNGYYFSSSKGTIQLITWTSKNLFKEYLPEMQKFLNGLAVSE